MNAQEQIAELARGLEPDAVKKVQKGGAKLSYVAGWYVIGELNRIFGFDGWDVALEGLEPKGFERKGKEGKTGVAVSVVARVSLTVRFADGALVRRAGVGAGSHVVYSGDWAEAYEKAAKEADTDALKRAARTLGNRFGLSLYDKDNALHAGGDDDHGAEPEPEPEPEPEAKPEAKYREIVSKICDTLLERAKKLGPDRPSEVMGWIDVQVKDLDRLTTEDMRRLVGSADKPGSLVIRARMLQIQIDEREKTRLAESDTRGT